MTQGGVAAKAGVPFYCDGHLLAPQGITGKRVEAKLVARPLAEFGPWIPQQTVCQQIDQLRQWPVVSALRISMQKNARPWGKATAWRKLSRGVGERHHSSWRNSTFKGSSQWLVTAAEYRLNRQGKKLGMVRLPAKVGVQHFSSMWRVV